MKQVCKTRKIRKTFVNCSIFAWDNAGKRRFEQFFEYEFAISLAVKKFAV